MNAFALMVDAQFRDRHLSVDAVYRVGGTGEGRTVRVRRRSPEGIVSLGDNRFDLNAMLIDVRLSEVESPAEGDTFAMLAEGGDPAETVEVIGMAGIDARRLVRTCEVQVVPPQDDADP